MTAPQPDTRFAPPWAPWTHTLERFAERVKPDDFRYFDYAIVDGDQAVHTELAAKPELTELTSQGHGRLYRINLSQP